MFKKFIIFTLLMILSTSSGCTLKKDDKNLVNNEQENLTSKEDEIDIRNAKIQKFNAYIDVNNLIVDTLVIAINSYFEYVPFQEEFNVNGDYLCNSLSEDCFVQIDNAYEYAKNTDEPNDVEESYLALYPVMKEMMEALNEVHKYTNSKLYLEDDYEKGKQLHEVIWKTYNEFEILASDFTDKLSILSEQYAQDDLQHFQENGFVILYSMNDALLKGQKIQNAIYEQGVTDANVIELNIDALKPLYDEFVEVVDKCDEYFEDSEQLTKEKLSSENVNDFKVDMKKTKLALTELFERVQEQKPIDDLYTNSSMLENGSIGLFEECLSNMIDSYNYITY